MHVIRRNVVEVELPSAEGAFEWQQRVSRLVQEQLAPHLSTLFDRYAGPDQLLRLDRVDLRVAVREGQDLAEQLVPQVLQALEGELRELVPEPGSMPDVPDSPRVVPEGLRAWQAFLFFLENGVLPWWAVYPDFPALQTKAIAALSLEGSNPSPSRSAFLQILRRDHVLHRLLWQFPDTFLEALTAWVAGPEAAGWFRRAMGVGQAVVQKSTRSGQPEHFLFQVRKQVLQLLFFKKYTREQPLLEQLVLSLAQNQHVADLPPLVRAFWEEWLLAEQVKPAWPASLPEPLAPGREEEILSLDPVLAVNLSVREKQEEEGPEEEPPEQEGLYVSNAGLVLLAPFLVPYLRATGAVEEEKMRHPYRAVHLVQLLVQDRSETPEYELTLNKLLCGLPPDEPVPWEVALPEEVRAEVQNLLTSVISYWGALRNTSPAGLRESFLQRFGRLSRKPDGGWLLQVEQKSYDLLLDHLPWSYSLIKLPWMPQALWVEWT
jgi:hypothetical protein